MRVVLERGAKMPTRATEGSVGYDLYSREDVWVPAGGVVVIDTGVHAELAPDEMGEVRGRSGLAKRGVMVATGTLDPDYRGSIGVILYNVSGIEYHIHEGDRVAQLVILPVRTPELVQVDSLSETARGDGGFGSTGK